MSGQTTLDGIAAPIEIGDHLDRCYTPDKLADRIVAAITFDPSIVIEPSVGGGAFARAVRRRWRSAHLIGVDLDPGAEGFSECDRCIVADFTKAGPKIGHPDAHPLIIGNPPFSGDTAIPHVEAALWLAPRSLVLILPLAFLAVDRWAHLMDGQHRPAIVRPIRPRPWGDRVRETAVYEWHRGFTGTTALIPLEWR